MEQKKELMVYKFEATRLKRTRTETVSDEIEMLACGYAFEGDPSPRVEYNRYWEFGGGCLNLVSKDGRAVDSCVDSMLEWMYDQGFRGVDINKMIDRLDTPGKWAEVCLGDVVKTMLRVTRLQELPEIDREATIRDSDLSPAQQHRVRIDGVPLFPEGGTVNASDPKSPTLVLRPDLVRELGKVWEEVIYRRGSVNVNVSVSTEKCSVRAADVKLTVKASTREALDTALNAIGVLRPQDIEPDVVEGDGGATVWITATVILTTEV